jgi:hypothetical protein
MERIFTNFPSRERKNRDLKVLMAPNMMGNQRVLVKEVEIDER